ncbi:MAG: beta-CASP ribonuclease aCPSF1 [Methanothrix sp.]|uniref:beta-CASP ribonuclease aCPSF1 n=1 Tax=Methanothrix sp. TaxID=90426 RepID=UPI0034564886|nr:beta-CASP ribonuclease aCPSF1 [Methanothrix sp.]
MSVEEVLFELKRKVQSKLPPEINVTGLEFEGPELVIYTDDPRKLADDGEIIRNLAKELRKRVVVRPDLKVLADPEAAIIKIQEVVPKEAVLTNYYFDGETGEVQIEAEKPGLVIGRHGATLREITKLIGWTPKVVRTPPVRSATIANIKDYLRSVQSERKSILRTVGRKIHRDIASKDQWVRITTLGGCREVGRSCMLLSTPESRIIIDCGINVGSDDSATPYLYVPEVYPLNQIDAVVLTHAHLDHAGLVPMLYKYGYEGPIYCTPPTRDLFVLLQLDYIEIAGREGNRLPYDSGMIREALKHTITLNYGDVTDIAPDTKLTMHNAGHILGSSIAHFHIGDGLYNVAFTGDFKFERTRLFDPAVCNFPRLETLVTEATYGGANSLQPSRKEAEVNLIKVVRETINRRGKVIIPAFSVGRSQEVMVVLEEAIRKKVIDEVPVCLDGMIYEATAIHTTYPEYLNSDLRDLIFHKGINPFLAECFVQVESPKQRTEIVEGPPCVILATSGMLNGGPVIEYLKRLGPDEKNTLVIVGYQAEGTLGRRIQKGWKEVPLSVDGKTQTVKINLEVTTVDGFSGHSDRQQLMEYIRRIYPKPGRVLTNHGEEGNCLDLASSIYKRFRIPTMAPMNLETIRLI